MSKYQRKQASGKIRINDDAYIYMRSDNVRADVYYFRISKQPHWRKPYVKSLRTTNKEIALEMAMKEYDEVMEQQRVVQATIFNEEDVRKVLKNSDFVINLVGILYETRKQKFDAIHSFFLIKLLTF